MSVASNEQWVARACEQVRRKQRAMGGTRTRAVGGGFRLRAKVVAVSGGRRGVCSVVRGGTCAVVERSANSSRLARSAAKPSTATAAAASFASAAMLWPISTGETKLPLRSSTSVCAAKTIMRRKRSPTESSA